MSFEALTHVTCIVEHKRFSKKRYYQFGQGSMNCLVMASPSFTNFLYFKIHHSFTVISNKYFRTNCPRYWDGKLNTTELMHGLLNVRDISVRFAMSHGP